ncbi:alpha/beta hydrolase [Actinokineospora auranticolor]|uniref:Alpha/beta hydrolase family protein n=1 Tax=Actinokineospora auranticolor TaxID=155976 RepID=A0A2S6GC91_9PSEU|nr:alpha/beta hydrolase [Actinokineospora auranticolor]PPK62058.1 alpha/beta hydrolase family protein [Actinokineospora auranticolor]
MRTTTLVTALVTAAVASVVAATGAQAQTPARDRVAWQKCGERGADCGSVSVPLDWNRPGGAKITVAVSRLKATDPAKRIGVLVFNPGGPGGPGSGVVRDNAAELFPRDLLDRFDLIGLDPRGVGDSKPAIACEKPVADPAVTQFPRDQAGYDRLVAYNRVVADGCRRKTGPLIDHVDTVSAARDIDAVRVALGEDKVNLLGLSYGTFLGSTYASLYPDRVRAFVLDGAVDHTVGSRRMALDETRTTEEVFAEFGRWCASDPTCALHGRDAVAEYRALLDRATRHPVPATGVPGGLTAEQIGYAAYSYLILKDYWPYLATAIRDAATDAAGLVGEVSSPAYRAIACHDFPSDVRDFADLSARLREVRTSPTARGYVEAWDIQAGCLGWPIRAKNPWGPTPVRGAPPILVVSGEHDPSTPNAWGIGLARQIACSRLLVWKGYGHTAYLNDPATQRREVDFLLNPTR